MADRIDTDKIRQIYPVSEIVGRYVKLNKAGSELVGLCPFHGEKTPSFTIVDSKNMFFCHGCGASGDVIKFVMNMTGVDFRQAVEAITGETLPAATYIAPPADIPATAASDYDIITPVPGDAPPLVTDGIASYFQHKTGEQVSRAVKRADEYRDEKGKLLGVVIRREWMDRDTGRTKKITPTITFCTGPNGFRGWVDRAFSEPRPLQGLDALSATAADVAVIIVEGEKAAAAARTLFPGKVVITWPNGGKAVSRAEWSELRGRKRIIIWPDADSHLYKSGPDAPAELVGTLKPWAEQEGARTAAEIATILHGLNSESITLGAPEGWPASYGDGWDAADMLAEGATPESAKAWMKAAIQRAIVEGVAHWEMRNMKTPPAFVTEQHTLADAVEVNYSSGDFQIASPPRGDVARQALIAMGSDVRDGGLGADAPMTELGNAKRLERKHGCDLRFVPDAGKNCWLIWNDGRWVWDRAGAGVRGMASELHLDIYAEATRLREYSQMESVIKWARKSQEKRTIENATQLLSIANGLRVCIEQVNADPLIVGFDGGRRVVDFRTGTQRDANRDDLVTKSLGIAYVGESSLAINWLRFLDQVIIGSDGQPDRELQRWLQLFVGYCLTGNTSEQIVTFFYGSGANGKSVFLNVLTALLGDYCRNVQPETFMAHQRNCSGPSPDIAVLPGARLVVANETEGGSRLSESLIKQMSGGDRLTARALHSDPFEFTPNFKIVMVGNAKPIIRGMDNGIWRRMRMLSFRARFEGQNRDDGLTAKLLHELPDIAAWAIEGAAAWHKNGLGQIPAQIVEATNEYKSEMDVLGQWIDECCEVEKGATVSATVAYENYKLWSINSGMRPPSKPTFGQQMTERCTDKIRRSEGVYYRGLRTKFG